MSLRLLLRFKIHSVNTLGVDNMNEKSPVILSLDRISKRYGEKVVLDDISFNISKGEIVGLLGRNGAGKTTILKSILGIKSYDSGEILYKGTDLREKPDLSSEFGALIDSSFLDYVSAYENIKLLMLASGKFNERDIKLEADKVFELVGLHKDKKLKVNQYSFGMKQRLGLAQAILFGKDFMMLDEPFVGLDPLGKDIIKKEIIRKAKEENGCVLFSSHDLEDVEEICDRVIMIKDGVCVYDGPTDQGKIYKIETLDTNNEILSMLVSDIKDAKLENGFITVDEENINETLKNIYGKNLGVKSISIEATSLIRLFKGGE